jgi:acyl-coenzyme A thioesterase PaaI-like protein
VSVVHRGSRLVIANTNVTHNGRTVAIATGTTALRDRR